MAKNYIEKTAEELDINYYINLAKEQVGQTHDLTFQSNSKWGEKAGEYTIVSFTEDDPHWTYSGYDREPNYLFKNPQGAILGTFKIRFSGTKFYNGKTFTFEVHAGVQNKGRVTNDLYIMTENLDTGKFLRAYDFPILNWDSKDFL